MSAPASFAADRILSALTMTPRSIDLVVVAAQHHPHDVLADVVDVALDGGQDDLRLPARAPLACFSASRKGVSQATAFFITRALLTTWGRNILPAPKRSPTTFMPAISGPSMTSRGRPSFAERLLGVRLDEVVDPPDQGVAEALLDAPRRQASSSAGPLLLGLHRLGEGDQPLGGVGAPVQEDVLDPLQELGGDLLVDRQLPGVDDPHVETGADRVEEEGRVHRLAHRVVPAEGEGHVARSRRSPSPGAGSP